MTRHHFRLEKSVPVKLPEPKNTRLRSPAPQDKRGVDLISDVLPFGRLWYAEPNAIGNAINYAKFLSRSHGTVIRVFDETGNLRATHEQAGDFRFEQPLTILPCEDGAL